MKILLVVALAITAVMGLPAAEPAAEPAAAPELDPREAEFSKSLEARKELEGRQGGYCYYESRTGVCRYTNVCTDSFSWYVSNRCMNDPSPDIRCCMKTNCRSGTLTGVCMNTSARGRDRCYGSGGIFTANLCPGPSDVQCCLFL